MSFDTRRLTDARVMRALAHPTRIDLLELVAREGELTATQAAQRLGLDAGQLLVPSAPAREVRVPRGGAAAPGPVAAVAGGSVRHSWEGVGPDAETNAAASALTSVVLERDLAGCASGSPARPPPIRTGGGRRS